MSFFSPYKRHADKFNYRPRYYDPDREQREQRRAELRGERLDDDEEYTPGKYIRTQRAAREARRAKDGDSGSRMKMWVLGVGVLLLALFLYLLYPRIVAMFEMAYGDKRPAQGVEEYEEFDPYAPITIVPNDYEEGDELIYEE